MQRPLPDTIPSAPGVYLYKDSAGHIIYVGKARILRRRVLSYFREDGLPQKTLAMLRHAASLETLTTTTEKEALLLEASLIKKHRPRYNIVLRDDKQYVLFRLDIKKPFARLEIVRQARRDTARYFGPFTSALAARETWKLIHRTFPLRRCTDRAMKNRVRPCLYHHIGQCPAPCTENISIAEYAHTVQQVAELLSGNSTALLASLRTEMDTAATALEFEKAARLRDQIRAVEHTVERQAAILPGGGDMDAVGISLADKGLALGIIFVRNGAIVDGRSFYWHGLEADAAPEALWSFLSQFYAVSLPPPRILLPWIPPEDTENTQDLLEQSLTDKRQGTVRIHTPRNPSENQLVDVATANAKEEIRKRREFAPEERLKDILQLPHPPRRIECVDVSHTGGQQTRVGLIVFEDGKAQSQDARVYTMPDGTCDDYATLSAWIPRRLKSGPPWPDLLLIDGGRGQLAAISRALQEAGQPDLFPIAAIAKARKEDGQADRRAGNTADRIFLPGRQNPLPFREGAPELLFLQHIRDCTHRFAIGRHRRARAGAALTGELMRLPGIGTATARLLWDHFGSVEAMRKATLKDLTALPGIGAAKAASIIEKLGKL